VGKALNAALSRLQPYLISQAWLHRVDIPTCQTAWLTYAIFREGNSGGSARGGRPLRVYVIGRDYQATEIDAADAARRFTAWVADGTNAVLAMAIRARQWQPRGAGGQGALAGSGREIATLRTRITVLGRHTPQQREPDGREAR
jgi:hypothetical protein